MFRLEEIGKSQRNKAEGERRCKECAAERRDKRQSGAHAPEIQNMPNSAPDPPVLSWPSGNTPRGIILWGRLVEEILRREVISHWSQWFDLKKLPPAEACIKKLENTDEEFIQDKSPTTVIRKRDRGGPPPGDAW